MAADAAAAARGTGWFDAGTSGAAARGNGGMVIHFNPTIQVQGAGSGVKEQVTDALKLSLRELEQMIERIAARQQRRAY